MAEYKGKLLKGLFVKSANVVTSDGTPIETAINALDTYVKKKNLGTSVSLTDNASYTCLSDGYFHVQIADGTNNYCYQYIGSTLMWGGMYFKNSAAAQVHNTLFVKAGMSIRFHGSGATGNFIPLT